MSLKPEPRRRPFRTLYFRFALLFFLVMVFAAGVLFGGTFITLFRSLQREDELYSQRRLLSYWARYQAQGIDGLVEGLRAETLFYDERPFFVRMATSDNRTIFLSFPEHWQGFEIKDSLESVDAGTFESEFVLRNQVSGYSLEVSTTILDRNYLIQVGMSTERREAFLKLFQRNFLGVLIFMLLFGLSAGLFIANRAVTPLRRLSLTLNTIILTGNLSDRMPVRGTGDELDELGELFNRMLERIEALIGRMRETLDTVAHDLRTPLTRLRGTAELALQSNDPEQQSEALSDSLEESERILTLITSLMDISEAESGILRLDRQLIDPRPALERVAEVYQFIADERGISIQMEGEFPTEIHADPTRFSQVAGNLLDNAVKYSPDGGQITVRGSESGEGSESVFRLDIENEGPSIPEPEIDRIWERLYRAAGNTAPGLGLGLSLVRAVVEAHGGSAAVRNIPGDGVRFSVMFPVRIADQPLTEPDISPRTK